MEFRRLVYFSYSEVVCSLCLFVAKIKIMLKVPLREGSIGLECVVNVSYVRCVRMCSLYVFFVKFGPRACVYVCPGVKFGPRACVYVCGASWR